MTTPRADLLTPFEKGEILASIQDVLDDAQLKVSLTYSRLSSLAYNVETGVVTRTAQADTVNAFRRFVTVQEVARSGGLLHVGDREYLIEVADLTLTPTTQDRITEGTETLEVVSWQADPLGHFYQVQARTLTHA